MTKMEFGKYKGAELSDVPDGYLQFLIRNSQEKIDLYSTELKRREMDADEGAGWLERIAKAGFRELSKRHHPDAGGTAEDFTALNAAYEQLKKMIQFENPWKDAF